MQQWKFTFISELFLVSFIAMLRCALQTFQFRWKQRKNVFLSFGIFFSSPLVKSLTAFCSVLNSQIWTKQQNNIGAQKCASKYNKSHVLSFIVNKFIFEKWCQTCSYMHTHTTYIGLDGIDMLRAYINIQ